MKDKILTKFSSLSKQELLEEYKSRVNQISKAIEIENFDELLEEIEVISTLLIADVNE